MARCLPWHLCAAASTMCSVWRCSVQLPFTCGLSAASLPAGRRQPSADHADWLHKLRCACNNAVEWRDCNWSRGCSCRHSPLNPVCCCVLVPPGFFPQNPSCHASGMIYGRIVVCYAIRICRAHSLLHRRCSLATAVSKLHVGTERVYVVSKHLLSSRFVAAEVSKNVTARVPQLGLHMSTQGAG
jgi:hypothetical protein